MNIFIAVDMEGATGVVHPDQLMPEGRGYVAGQRLLTGDVNAAIRGVLSVVPEASFVVGDGHGIMRNVLLEELHPSAALVMGPARPANKPLCQLEGMDHSFDMAIFVGFHTKAGTPGGLLAHTYVGSVVCDWRLNGRSVGEAEMNAAIAATYGIPVGLVTGNSDLEAEIRSWNHNCGFVSVKRTLGPSAAICLTPTRTHRMIEDAAAAAVHACSTGALHVHHAPAPVIEVEMYRREQAEKASHELGVFRDGDRTIRCEGGDAAAVFRMAWRGICRAMDEPAGFLT